jgi:hypothetical protein
MIQIIIAGAFVPGPEMRPVARRLINHFGALLLGVPCAPE